MSSEYEHCSLNYRDYSDTPQEETGDFINNMSNDFGYILVTLETIAQNETA